MKQEKKSDWLALGLLALFWVFFHYRILFLGQTEVLLDSSRFFYPLWKWGAGVWKQGLIPLWNPDAAFGTPYLADPDMAAWYPPIVFLYSLFTPTAAFNILTVGHHLWALAGFFLFARNRGFSPWVALEGSLIFGFSFNAVSLAWITPILFVFSWIPWVFLAADRLFAGKKGSFLFFCGAFAAQMSAGYPLLAYLSGLALLLDWLLKFWGQGQPPTDLPATSNPLSSTRPRYLPTMGLGLLGAGFAFVFNLPWLLPLKEMIPLSNLKQRLEMNQGMDLDALGTWLNPFLKGHPLLSHPNTPFSFTVYFMGLPALVLILWGCLRGKIRKPALFLFLAVFFLSLGETGWVGGWLKSFLPGYSLVVRSGYWIPLVVFSATLLLMEPLREIFREPRKAPHPGPDSLFWAGATVLVYLSALWAGPSGLWALGSFWLSFWAALAAGITFGGWVPAGGRKLFFLLAVLFSLGPAAQAVDFTLDNTYYEKPPEFLDGLRVPGRFYFPLREADDFQTISGNSVQEAYEKQKSALVPNLPLGYGREEIGFANPLFLRSFLGWYFLMGEAPNPKLADYLNVAYVFRRETDGRFSWVQSASAPLPKWFAVQKALPDRASPGAYLESLPGDFKGNCVVSAAHAGAYAPRRVEEISRTPSEVRLMAKGRGMALLVSSETAYPGWRAQVKGVEKPVETVNQDFRGILLEDGENEVELRYAPTSFRLGCFLFLCACGLWFWIFLKELGNLRGKHA